jgi:hypothetical protein
MFECFTRSSRAPPAALSLLLAPLRPRHLAHRTASCMHVLAGMMIDASRWACARLRYARSRSVSLSRTGLLSFLSALPLDVDSLLRRFAHEVLRELLTRHRGHDLDQERVGANNDTSTDSDPGPDVGYSKLGAARPDLSARPPLRRAAEHHTRKPYREQFPPSQRGSGVLDAPREVCEMLANGRAQRAAHRCSPKRRARRRWMGCTFGQADWQGPLERATRSLNSE